MYKVTTDPQRKVKKEELSVLLEKAAADFYLFQKSMLSCEETYSAYPVFMMRKHNTHNVSRNGTFFPTSIYYIL